MRKTKTDKTLSNDRLLYIVTCHWKRLSQGRSGEGAGIQGRRDKSEWNFDAKTLNSWTDSNFRIYNTCCQLEMHSLEMQMQILMLMQLQIQIQFLFCFLCASCWQRKLAPVFERGQKAERHLAPRCCRADFDADLKVARDSVQTEMAAGDERGNDRDRERDRLSKSE